MMTNKSIVVALLLVAVVIGTVCVSAADPPKKQGSSDLAAFKAKLQQKARSSESKGTSSGAGASVGSKSDGTDIKSPTRSESTDSIKDEHRKEWESLSWLERAKRTIGGVAWLARGAVKLGKWLWGAHKDFEYRVEVTERYLEWFMESFVPLWKATATATATGGSSKTSEINAIAADLFKAFDPSSTFDGKYSDQQLKLLEGLWEAYCTGMFADTHTTADNKARPWFVVRKAVMPVLEKFSKSSARRDTRGTPDKCSWHFVQEFDKCNLNDGDREGLPLCKSHWNTDSCKEPSAMTRISDTVKSAAAAAKSKVTSMWAKAKSWFK
jgi:hypothetical protein